MLIIRLSRIGKKKHPTFRIIISEKTKDTKGDYLELLGSYNPHTNEAKIKAERVKYWLSKGAKMSGTINNLFINKKVIEGKKVKVFKPKKKVTTEATEIKKPTETREKIKAKEVKKTEPAEKKEEVKKDEKQVTTEKKEAAKKEEPAR